MSSFEALSRVENPTRPGDGINRSARGWNWGQRIFPRLDVSLWLVVVRTARLAAVDRSEGARVSALSTKSFDPRERSLITYVGLARHHRSHTQHELARCRSNPKILESAKKKSAQSVVQNRIPILQGFAHYIVEMQFSLLICIYWHFACDNYELSLVLE